MRVFKKLILGGLVAITVFTAVGVGTTASASEYFNEKYYDPTIPDGYYTSVDTSLTGNAFKESLYEDISRNYVQHSYSYNSTVLLYTDPDPKHPGKVIGFYSGDSLSTGAWNKEHVWAKSHGFPQKGAEPYCDAHHLRPTYNNINSRRSNFDFGEITSGGNPDKYGNKQAGGVFEPRDEVKGDVARIMFYMETRYGSKTRFNLKLVTDRTTDLSDGNGRFGGLNDLLKWHYADPVSKEEIYRNNVIYEDFQHNRNPYIDHPEWVKLAFPNDYEDNTDPKPNPNPDVNDSSVKEVIDLINELPTMITLDDKDNVNSIKTKYDALGNKKSSVTNSSKLTSALATIKKLEYPTVSGDITVPSDGISISKALEIAKTAGDSGSSERYIIKGKLTEVKHQKWGNITITDGTNSIYAHSCYAANGKDLYETVSPAPKIGDTLTLSVKLGTFKGKAEALDAYVLGVNLPDTPKPDEDVTVDKSFVLEETKASLKVAYSEASVDADLRFGTRIKASSFDSKAKYGVLVVEGNRNLTSGLQEATSISAYTKNKALEIDPARVDENGALAEDGEYYQFAWVITNMEGHYGFEFNAVIYMELNGKLYFGKPIKSSLNKTTEFMLDNNLVSDPVVKKVLEDLLK